MFHSGEQPLCNCKLCPSKSIAQNNMKRHCRNVGEDHDGSIVDAEDGGVVCGGDPVIRNTLLNMVEIPSAVSPLKIFGIVIIYVKKLIVTLLGSGRRTERWCWSTQLAEYSWTGRTLVASKEIIPMKKNFLKIHFKFSKLFVGGVKLLKVFLKAFRISLIA